MKIRITNTYSDGHESSTVEEVDEPRWSGVHGLDDKWWEDKVLPLTGDGHGLDPSLGWCYTAVVEDAVERRFVGMEREWSGN